MGNKFPKSVRLQASQKQVKSTAADQQKRQARVDRPGYSADLAYAATGE